MVLASGYLKKLLETQLRGLTGHIEEAGYPFNRVGWDNPIPYKSENKYPTWWVYEQTAYWLDGYLRAGIVLNDKKVISRASSIIYKVLERQGEDGFLGPETLRHEQAALWPYVVFFRACLALYDYNQDRKIIEALTNFYLKSDREYRYFRDVINVEIMLDLYGVSKDERLLSLAEKTYKEYNENSFKFNQITDKTILSHKKPFCHGVTYNEYTKLPALLYRYTKNPYYQKIATRAMRTLVGRFMLPGQCPCSDELTISNYYMECYETCDISDFTWTNAILEQVFKRPLYGDYVERCVFNAGMGSVLENFKGLQYFSCANQFLATSTSTHCEFSKGKKWMSYRPNPGTECCPGNVNRFLPNYVLNMFKEEGNDIYSYLYGPAEFSSEDKAIHISEETDFPFTESVVYKIETSKPFAFHLRIPSYAQNMEIQIGDKVIKPKMPGFKKLLIKVSTVIKVTYQPEIKAEEVRGGGAYIERGALVYSYGQFGKRKIDKREERSSKAFPAYEIYPEAPFGYKIDKDHLFAEYKAGTDTVFDLRKNLPSITIDAYKEKDVELVKKEEIEIVSYFPGDRHKKVEKVKGHFVFTPDLLKEKHECERAPVKLTLYPYGACKLRETVFKVKE